MKDALCLVLCIFLLTSCSYETPGKNEKDSKEKKATHAVSYQNWKSVEGRAIKFKYPGNWRVRTKSENGTTQFGLTNDSDTAIKFFPVEIWEFDDLGNSFEDFAAVPHQYFVKMTDGKMADLVNLKSKIFKNLEAKYFEFKKNDFPVEIITINGGQNYYMIVAYREKSYDPLMDNIINSVEINYTF